MHLIFPDMLQSVLILSWWLFCQNIISPLVSYDEEISF